MQYGWSNWAEPWIQNYYLGELCPQDIKDTKLSPAPPDAIEAREFFGQRIKRRGAREKNLFPSEASNYELGGSSPQWRASSSIRHAKKDWATTCSEWFAKTLRPWCVRITVGIKDSGSGELDPDDVVEPENNCRIGRCNEFVHQGWTDQFTD
jgi:hypothetical protein